MGTYDDIDHRLDRHIEHLLEHGWLPADLAHMVRKHFTQRHERLAVGLIARHARRHDALTRAPDEWLAELDRLGVLDRARGAVVGGHGVVVERWAKAEQLDLDEVAEATALLDGLWALARPLPHIVPPPSRWTASNRGSLPRAAPAGDVPEKTLHTIRALLAKAERTEFEAEAEAFTAKAQELMTRHSIDAAMLAAHAAGAGSHAGIVSRRVHLDDPYAEQKAVLLSVLARVNGAKCVWSSGPGFCTVMGFPVDVQLTELLFTSLLVQATHASGVATAHDPALRTASFRRAFMVSFASRIAERLEAARSAVTAEAADTYGSELAPVLAARDAAVDAAYQAAFPKVSSMRARRYDAEGWDAGRAAADRADIGAGASLPEA